MKICIIGSGYVGLALAVEFGKKFDTISYDINKSRIDNLKDGIDDSNEFNVDELKESAKLAFTNNASDIHKCDYYIITVGTPIYANGRPDLSAIISASELVGSVISQGATVIFESTVYPGVTEEICAPIIQEKSSLHWKKDFNVGYSPERINPGDKSKRINDIIKIISGDTQETVTKIFNLYSNIINAGLHIAPTIKVAEAAKVIENTQRDLNIALVNELSIIFDRLEIDTKSVIEAASTKWNFISLKPGLVGGHCISIDPYYLLYKSEVSGYVPTLIHAGRKINEFMPIFICNKFSKYCIKSKNKILIIGFTFKDNCSDIRNTKIYDLYVELINRGYLVDIYDARAIENDVSCEYGVTLTNFFEINKYDNVIYCVNHNEHYNLMLDSHSNCKLNGKFILDVTGELEFLNNSKDIYYSRL